MSGGPPCLSPKKKRAKVTFVLDTSPRTERMFGPDVFARILRMRINGKKTCDIAKEIGCSRDLVEGQFRLWEQQLDTVCAEIAEKQLDKNLL